MTPRGALPRLHAITDERIARRPDLDDVARRLAAGGGQQLAFHARGRALSGLAHFDLANRLRAYAPTRLFVNDRLDVALAARASGVQLTRSSLPPREARAVRPDWWIGLSVHDLEQATAALVEAPDYLLVGPVFPTTTHPDRPPLGLARLAEIVALGLPVIAIGGVTGPRIPELRQAGVHGAAAIRALWDAGDPADAARRMVEELAR
ncbi:MAG TPA: thiamine phosphate synthase [Gemmatimonadales bacterium]|nr:thiamine phosphate synthase [Gemmatimonadales bacterium]